MFKRKGQSIAEYAVVLGLVVAAVMAMQVYVGRGLKARIKSGTDAFNTADATITVGTNTATFKNQSQYEPYYLVSEYDTYQESVEQEHMKEGKVKKEKVSDITARKEGGFQSYIDADKKGTRDAYWDGK